MKIIDVHAHYEDDRFSEDLEQTLEKLNNILNITINELSTTYLPKINNNN